MLAEAFSNRVWAGCFTSLSLSSSSEMWPQENHPRPWWEPEDATPN